MKYCNRRERYLTDIDLANKMLKQLKEFTVVVEESPDKINAHSNTTDFTYVQDGQRYLKFTTRYFRPVGDDSNATVSDVEFVGFNYKDKYVCTWIVDKTGGDTVHIRSSSIARMWGNIYKPFDIVAEDKDLNAHGVDPTFTYLNAAHCEKALQSAKPLLGFNPKFDGTEHQVYIYDLNSAYAVPLTDKIIDTYHDKHWAKVGDNEVGFFLDRNMTMVTKKGVECDYVFPLIDSPYKDYAMELYNQKKTSPKGSKERAIAKSSLVQIVGIWQNHNPFLRAYVVNSCNNYIQSIIDKHKDTICMWNTDAVYSTEPLDDLPMGNEIGQFKLEYQGLFRQKGCNYQKVEAGEITYRGVLKSCFDDDFNILTDELPANNTYYIYDRKSKEIRLNGTV